MQGRLGFEIVALHFWRTSRTKRSFWRLGASLLEDVSYETLVLETWRFTFGGRLVLNARFGDLALHFWRKSRRKRSFWRFGTSLLEDVSYETLVLETWRFTFGGSLVGNASLLEEVSCETLVLETCASLLEKVSDETLVLETCRLTCGAGLRSGQLVVQM